MLTMRRRAGVLIAIERRHTFKRKALRGTSEILNLILNVRDPTMHLLWRVRLNVESSGAGDDLKQVVSQ